jgi:hypothetical protein
MNELLYQAYPLVYFLANWVKDWVTVSGKCAEYSNILYFVILTAKSYY